MWELRLCRAYKIKLAYYLVMIVATISTSLLFTYLAELPDFLKGFVLSIQITIYIMIFIVVLIFPESVCYRAGSRLNKNGHPPDDENSAGLDHTIRRLIEEEAKDV